MSNHPYPVRVSHDGNVAIRVPGRERRPWLPIVGDTMDDADVEDWTPYIAFDQVGAAVFADALNEWAAHWPPRKGNDVTLEPIYAPLAELSPEQLEQIAVAASSLSTRCWEIRRPQLLAEAEKRRAGE